MNEVTLTYIDGRPECPDCGDRIFLKEYPERPEPGKKPKWYLECPVCQIRLYETPQTQALTPPHR